MSGKLQMKGSVFALAAFITFGASQAYADSGSPSPEQLLKLIQKQQRQIEELQ